MGRWSLFIDGRQVEAERFQDVINPSTGGDRGSDAGCHRGRISMRR